MIITTMQESEADGYREQTFENIQVILNGAGTVFILQSSTDPEHAIVKAAVSFTEYQARDILHWLSLQLKEKLA